MLLFRECLTPRRFRASLWGRFMSASSPSAGNKPESDSEPSSTPSFAELPNPDIRSESEPSSTPSFAELPNPDIKSESEPSSTPSLHEILNPDIKSDPKPSHTQPYDGIPKPNIKAFRQGNQIKKTKVSRHLFLREVPETEAINKYIGKNQRPLVILFRWLYSTPSAINKYCTLYHDIGLDVLTVKGRLSHFLLPPVGTKLAQELFRFLKSYRPFDEPLLVHALSVGAYNYTIAMQEAVKTPDVCADFRKRVIGQIFDSIVIGTYENLSKSIAEALPQNEPFRRMVKSTMDSYYYVTHKTTRDAYDSLVQHFKEDPVHVPTLFFHSKDDPLCDPDAMEMMLAKWRSREFDVRSVSWTHSVHAAHLRFHREEYLAAWILLMEELQLV